MVANGSIFPGQPLTTFRPIVASKPAIFNRRRPRDYRTTATPFKALPPTTSFTMAAATGALLPRLAYSTTILSSSRWATLYTRNFTTPFLPALSVALPGVSLNIPGLLGDIWESILRAVPKKKVSHAKRRHRQMAGKALEDVNSLCKCPGCGATKRTHRLCQTCLNGTLSSNSSCSAGRILTLDAEMKDLWRDDARAKLPPSV